MEAAGIALGVVALAPPAVKVCLEGYKALSRVKFFAEDVSEFHLRLLTEAVRLQNWSVYWEPELSTVDGLKAAVTSLGVDETTFNLAMQRLYEIGSLLTDKHALKSYGLDLDYDLAPVMPGSDSDAGGEKVAASIGARLINQTMQHKAKVQMLQERVSFVRQLRWSVRDRAKFKNLIKRLKEHNDGLYEILPTYLKLAVQKANVAALTNSDSIKHLFSLGSDFGVMAEAALAAEKRFYDTVSAVAMFRATSLELDNGVPYGPAPPWRINYSPGMISYISPCSAQSVATPQQHPWRHTYLDREATSCSRVFAYLNDNPTDPVIIEWKKYDLHHLNHETSSILTQRLHNLACLLFEGTPKPKGLRILPGRGCFDDVANSRVGFVSRLPSHVSQPSPEAPLPRVKTLYSILGSDYVPDLGDRFRLAQALANGLLDLHMCNWLHKSVRSNNIIFLQDNCQSSEDRVPSLLYPYFVGFSYARKNNKDEKTRIEPKSSYFRRSSLNASQPGGNVDPEAIQMGAGWEHDLYHHPATLNSWSGGDTHNSGAERFQRKHDIFSLGIVLLEIGLWVPVKNLLPSHRSESSNSMVGGAQSVEVVRHLLSKSVKKLSYKCGGRYRYAVERCLTWDDTSAIFGKGKGVDVGQGVQSAPVVPEGLGAEFDIKHDAFNHQVVRVLGSCVA